MKVIYIAGPFRGPTPWDVECNVRKAEAVALAVAEAGAMPLCPHTMTRHFDKRCTDEFWLAGTMELLRRCDAIVMLPGWFNSEGSRAERGEARKIGLPTFDSYADLRAWIEAQA